MNPLVNVLTPKIRGTLYAILFFASLTFSAWQAADGDWLQFVGGLITSLLAATAASNASWTPVTLSGDLDGEPLPDTDSIHGGTGSSDPVSGNFPESNDYGYGDPHRY